MNDIAFPLRYGSVCSGIEAVSLAWRPSGLTPAWFAEIDPFANAVLAHHYPHALNLGDMTRIAPQVLSGSVCAPDILVGGTPCQSFSVAGMRKGLDDPRGALTLKYVELANAIDQVRLRQKQPPTILVWENVPVRRTCNCRVTKYRISSKSFCRFASDTPPASPVGALCFPAVERAGRFGERSRQPLTT